MFAQFIPMALFALVLFVGASLLVLGSGKNKANQLLATFFFIAAFSHAVNFVTYENELPYEQAIHVIPLIIAFVLGPLMLLYTKLLTGHQQSLKKANALGLLWGTAVAGLLCAPIIAGTIWFDIFDAQGELRPGRFSSAAGIAVFFVFLAIMPYTIVYVVLCWRLLVRRLRALKDVFSHIEDSSLNWLRWFLVLLTIQTAMVSVEFFCMVAQIGMVDANALDAFEFVLLFAMGLLAVRHTVQKQAVEPEEHLEQDETVIKYERSALSADHADRVARQLNQTMARDKLYRDPFLSLTALATKAQLKPHRISQVLNTHIGRSFFDFVNGWRINEAKEGLQDADMTILQISEEVGFNSRSTFYTAFKKEMGMTPTEYRRRVKAEKPVPSASAMKQQRYG